MDPDQYRAGVTELYQAEIVGEGLFSTLLANCPREHAYGMALLLQLEGEAKVRLRPFLWRLGLTLVEDESMRAAGSEVAQTLKNLPWSQAMLELAELVQPYLARYRALESAAPAGDRALVRFMVEHELTVLRFAELQVAGDTEGALQAVRAQLDHAWPAS
jgi:hypothetical protein